MARVCINRCFKPRAHRDRDVKVTWRGDDSQHLSLQTSSSLQKVGITFRYVLHTFFSHMFYAFFFFFLLLRVHPRSEK